MKIKHLLSLLLLCTTTVAFSQSTGILVLEEDMEVPAHCSYLGDVKVTDKGFKTNCGYERTMEEARRKTAKLGGNIFKIYDLAHPSAMGSTCYQVWGYAYYSDDIERTKRELHLPPDTITRRLIPDTARYAVVYAYRKMAGEGSSKAYLLHVGDAELGWMEPYTKGKVIIEKEGPIKIWAAYDKRVEMELNIQFGKAYFIKCDSECGFAKCHPLFTVQDPNKGHYEYDLISNH